MNRKHPKPNNQRKILRTRQLCAAAFSLAAGFSFQTAWADCRVSVPAVNEMKVDFLNNEGLDRTIEMDVTCRNTSFLTWSTQTYHICVNMDGTETGRQQVDPRYAVNGRNKLAYNVYTNPAGSNIAYSNTYLNGRDPNRILYTTVNIPAWESSAKGRIIAYVKIPREQIAAAGEYTANFNSSSVTANYETSDCRSSSGFKQNIINNFLIKTNVVGNCKIDKPANINFGEKSITDTNLNGNTNINVTCSKDHPYHIGLTTKNINNKEGRGSMRHTSGSDTIEYVLRKESDQGDPWGDSGNTAKTQGSRQFTGTGTQQLHPVYATIANIPPNASAGEYQDTVTVNVYY